MTSTASYATATELRAQINKITTSGIDDDDLQIIIDAASRAIDNFTNHPDGFKAISTATARIYAGSGMPYQWINECVEIDEVAVKESVTLTTYTAWAATDWNAFRGDPQAPNYNRLPYTGIMVAASGTESVFISGAYVTRQGFAPSTDIARGEPTVQITARWGYAAEVPTAIHEACIMQATRWYKRLQSAMADTVGGPELGTLVFSKALDPAVQMLLTNGRFVRPPIGR